MAQLNKTKIANGIKCKFQLKGQEDSCTRVVKVIRPVPKAECNIESESTIYKVCLNNGKEYYAFEEELSPLEDEPLSSELFNISFEEEVELENVYELYFNADCTLLDSRNIPYAPSDIGATVRLVDIGNGKYGAEISPMNNDNSDYDWCYITLSKDDIQYLLMLAKKNTEYVVIRTNNYNNDYEAKKFTKKEDAILFLNECIDKEIAFYVKNANYVPSALRIANDFVEVVYAEGYVLGVNTDDYRSEEYATFRIFEI